jgi:hypothetical protein
MASMQPDDEEPSTLSAELQAESLIKVVPVSGGRESIAAVGDLRAVAPLYTAQCPGDCGGLIEDGDWLVAVGSALDGSAAATADVWIKQGAAGWAAAAADPFGGGEGIAAVVVVPISSTVNRIIVARMSPDAGNPAEIAYSDDLGATWTAVNVGAVNGQFMAGPGALFAIDQYNIWAVTSGGYIYKSEDGGLTWTAQESGVLAAQTFYQVKFLSTSFGVVAGRRQLDPGHNQRRDDLVARDGACGPGGAGDHGAGHCHRAALVPGLWRRRAMVHRRRRHDLGAAPVQRRRRRRGVGHQVHQ